MACVLEEGGDLRDDHFLDLPSGDPDDRAGVATTINGGEGPGLRVAGVDLVLPIPVAAGTDVIFGIRPESLVIAPREPVPALGFSAHFVRGEQLGSETILHFDINGHRVLAKVVEHPTLRDGETVQVAFDRKSVCLFDATGERRLKWQ